MKFIRTFMLVVAALTVLAGAAQVDADVWTLQRCIDHAKARNIDLQRDRINVQQSQYGIKDAKADRLPSVSFSTNQQVSNRPFSQTTAVVSGSEVIAQTSNTSYSGQYGIGASMTLYNGGKLKNNIKLQELNGRAAELQVMNTELTIEENIAKTYVQILYAMETVGQDHEQIALSEKQVERAKALFDAGLLNRADVAQLESQLASDRFQLVSDEASQADYELQLKQMLELDGDTPLRVVVPDLTENVLAPLPAKADVYAQALALRPEIQLGQLDIERSEINEKIANADNKPTIGASVNSSTGNNSASGNMFTQLKNQWVNSLSVSLTLPIWDRGKTRNAVAKARLDREDSELALQETRKALWKTIENYWLNANSAQQRYVAAEERVNYTKISYELTSEQFRLGLRNIIELTTDKVNLISAQRQMLQAKYMALLNTMLLKFYAGQPINM